MDPTPPKSHVTPEGPAPPEGSGRTLETTSGGPGFLLYAALSFHGLGFRGIRWLGSTLAGTYLSEGSLGCLLAEGHKMTGEIVKRGDHERENPKPQYQEPYRGPTFPHIPPHSFSPIVVPQTPPDLGELERRLGMVTHTSIISARG